MAFRQIIARARLVPMQHNLKAFRGASTTSASRRLYEYVVIIHDLPTSTRPNAALPKPPVLQRQTFAGEIMGKGAENVCGDVLACRALSREEVETQLRAHPFAKGIWDMENIAIWPLETIHTSPLGMSSSVKTQDSSLS